MPDKLIEEALKFCDRNFGEHSMDEEWLAARMLDFANQQLASQRKAVCAYVEKHRDHHCLKKDCIDDIVKFITELEGSGETG